MQFSIIIPTLNEEKLLPRLLQSLANQTDSSFEVIIVDGRSTDKTVVKAKTFAKRIPHFSIITSETGVSRQRNEGARRASGQWLVFIDADGVVMPYFIERLKVYIAKKQPKLFTTWFMPDSDDRGDALITLLTNIVLEGSVSVKRPFAPGPLTVVEKRAFESIGGYDESLSFGEDYDLSKRLFGMGVMLAIFREALCQISLRRFRKEGRLRIMQTYARTALTALILNETPRVHGYVTGGQLYTGNSKNIKPSSIKRFQVKLRVLLKELFE